MSGYCQSGLWKKSCSSSLISAPPITEDCWEVSDTQGQSLCHWQPFWSTLIVLVCDAPLHFQCSNTIVCISLILLMGSLKWNFWRDWRGCCRLTGLMLSPSGRFHRGYQGVCGAVLGVRWCLCTYVINRARLPFGWRGKAPQRSPALGAPASMSANSFFWQALNNKFLWYYEPLKPLDKVMGTMGPWGPPPFLHKSKTLHFVSLCVSPLKSCTGRHWGPKG